jgi:MvaI/BcnI restriction endonuclease family
MKSLTNYADSLALQAGKSIKNGQIFAKILTTNDDAGRHGILIPTDVYSFFPNLEVLDPDANATALFKSFDTTSNKSVELAFKYYHRYPERRITKFNGIVNERDRGLRLQIVLRGELPDGQVMYMHDATNEFGDARFEMLWGLLAGSNVKPIPGAYVVAPIQYTGLAIDAPLTELLSKFDSVRGQWFDSLRTGDTGIGYTFETLLGIKENNDQTADFQGIELKCKQRKSANGTSSGKLNLFQLAPVWEKKQTSIERLMEIGLQNSNDLYSCYSQVTTTPNNLLLAHAQNLSEQRINLLKGEIQLGHWLYKTLEKRLLEKHSRAAFILTSVSKTKTGAKFRYEELIYCEQPNIDRFLDLVQNNQLVFEFMMSEKTKGKVRNHGYPWRLIREDLLDQLFAVRAKLR